MLVPRGRFYRRQKTRSRTGSASIFRAVRGPKKPQGVPQRPSARSRTTDENAPSAGCAGCAGCACGGGVARCGRCRAVASRAAAPNRTSYYRYPAAGEPNTYESIGVHGGPYIHALQQDPERERERGERERESLMQQGMVMHVTVLRLTCNGLRSRGRRELRAGRTVAKTDALLRMLGTAHLVYAKCVRPRPRAQERSPNLSNLLRRDVIHTRAETSAAAGSAPSAAPA